MQAVSGKDFRKVVIGAAFGLKLLSFNTPFHAKCCERQKRAQNQHLAARTFLMRAAVIIVANCQKARVLQCFRGAGFRCLRMEYLCPIPDAGIS